MAAAFNFWGGNVKVIFALVAALPFAVAQAANDGDLWEVTTQMNVPGMPAGMGTQKQQVCTEKGDAKKAMQGKGSEKCRQTDFKQSGNKITITMECPDGTATIENTYNAAHTEYNGTVKMTSKRGDMTMTMAGKKLGACDAQAAKAEREDKNKKAMAGAAAAQAEGNRVMAQSRQQVLDQMKGRCTEAVKNMNYKVMAADVCYGKESAQLMQCRPETMQKMDDKSREMIVPAEGKAFCEAKRTEFCKNLQTPDGFFAAAKAENVRKEGRLVPAAQEVPESSAFCGLKNEAIVASIEPKLCTRAQEKEYWEYLGTYCQAQAKPLYAKSCAGRDFTSLYDEDKKKFTMCRELGIALDERKPSTTAKAKGTVDSATQAVNQGAQQTINKIKGLFGK